jgi:hypothetical protein
VSGLEFEAWPKISRLNRDCVITEKLDGTNSAVIVTEDGQVGAQSRTRLITPAEDNYGFAKWVQENADGLAAMLGPGRHFGEWWGQGIQRRYDMDHKEFSLFNVSRWGSVDLSAVPNVGVVPTLYAGPFSTDVVMDQIDSLEFYGSAASPGFMKPEGVVVWHVAARTLFKVTLENDEAPKGLVQ